jgi:hypothetical protein
MGELEAVNCGVAKILSDHFGAKNVLTKHRAPDICHLMEQVKPVDHYDKDNLLDSERDHATRAYSVEALSLSYWIYKQGMEVLQRLVKYTAPAPSAEPPGITNVGNWRAVWFLSMHQISMY